MICLNFTKGALRRGLLKIEFEEGQEEAGGRTNIEGLRRGLKEGLRRETSQGGLEKGLQGGLEKGGLNSRRRLLEASKPLKGTLGALRRGFKGS